MYISNFMRFSLKQSEFKPEHPLVFIFFGTGISTESGIPTYRNKEINWRNHNSITAENI